MWLRLCMQSRTSSKDIAGVGWLKENFNRGYLSAVQRLVLQKVDVLISSHLNWVVALALPNWCRHVEKLYFASISCKTNAARIWDYTSFICKESGTCAPHFWHLVEKHSGFILIFAGNCRQSKFVSWNLHTCLEWVIPLCTYKGCTPISRLSVSKCEYKQFMFDRMCLRWQATSGFSRLTSFSIDVDSPE